MFHKILVPLDGTALAETALPYAVRLAEAHGSGLLIVRVVPLAIHPPPLYSAADAEVWLRRQAQQKQETEAYLDALARQPELAAAGTRWLIYESNSVAEQLIEVVKQQNVELIVLASKGRRGIARWLLGSVAQQVLEQSPVPVMVVPTLTAAAHDSTAHDAR